MNSDDDVDWNSLKQICAWTAIPSLRIPLKRTINDDLICVGRNAYLYFVSEKLPPTIEKGPFATYVLWAESDGAAKRAMSRDVEADEEKKHESPPSEMLLSNDCTCYGRMIQKLKSEKLLFPYTETAVYRTARDGIFMFREIHTGQYDFLFRNRKSKSSESPFAIAYRLIDAKYKASR